MNIKKKLKENRSVIFLVLGWLILVNSFSLLALNRFNLEADNAYSWISTDNYNQEKGWNLVSLHSRWDSSWYLDIVENGYKYKSDDALSNIVFFPVYPLLIKFTSSIFSVSNIFSGWMISCFFLFLSAIYLYRLIKEFHKESDPLLSVFLLLIFPTAFFLNAIYTESIFLFLSVASFYYALKRKYFWSALFGMVASLTRITGLFLFIPLIVQGFIQEGFERSTIKKCWPLFFIPIGTFLFFLFYWFRFGNFLLFFKVENAWGRSFHFNAEHFLFSSQPAIANFSLDIFYALFIFIIILALIKKKYWAYALYVALTVIAAMSSGTLMSIGRYILVLFPIYIIGSSIRTDLMKYAWIMISLSLMILNTILFVNWYWAG